MFRRRGAGFPLIKVLGGTPNALLASAKAEQNDTIPIAKLRRKLHLLHLQKVRHKRLTDCLQSNFMFYPIIFIKFFERFFNCLLLLLDNGVA